MYQDQECPMIDQMFQCIDPHTKISIRHVLVSCCVSETQQRIGEKCEDISSRRSSTSVCQASPDVIPTPFAQKLEQLPVKPDQPKLSSFSNYGLTNYAKEFGSKVPHKKPIKELQIKDSQRVYQLLNHHEIGRYLFTMCCIWSHYIRRVY